ncbi:MAG: AMP-binding protein [Propionibacteriaceae bacterium]|jgi:acyl-CoA synthetase (AMP-forming)/AMP-acid ligase II|nr:AMP-binding protein [Propionibacteriaceae bacterium]
MHQSLSDVLACQGQERERGIVFLGPGRPPVDFLSYADLGQTARRLSRGLTARGVASGDYLILRLDDNKMFVEAFWACVLGGFVPVPLAAAGSNELDRTRAVQDILPGSRVLGLSADFGPSEPSVADGAIALDLLKAEALTFDPEENARPVAPDTIRLVQFSSGSTGQPKGVIITERNIMAGLRACVPSGQSQDTVTNSMLSWLPLTHNLSLVGVHLYSLYRGYDQVLMPPTQFALDPLSWLKAITVHRPTVTFCPNFGCQHVLKAMARAGQSALTGLDLSSLHKIMNGAEPIDRATVAEFQDRLAPYGLRPNVMVPGYGLTEASLGVTAAGIYQPLRAIELDRSRIAVGAQVADIAQPGGSSFVSVGSPTPGVSVSIRSTPSSPTPDGVIGQIWVGGEPVTDRYVDASGQHRQELSPDGFLGTGDLGAMVDGDLFILGRQKDIIFVNGKNFYSHDLERVLEQALPVDCAVVGQTDPATGQEAVIVFLAQPGQSETASPSELEERAVEALMGRLGVPVDRLVWVPSIPRTRTGKRQRFELLDGLGRPA